jgi:putative peptidoglycan lipid II flippase
VEKNPAFGSRSYLVEKTRIVLLWRSAGVLSGLVIDAAILAFFGLGQQTDAFFAALAIPYLIDSTLAIQFTQVIVPVMAGIRQESGEPSVHAYLNNLITIWLLGVSCLAGVGMALAKLIIPLQVPGLSAQAILLAAHLNVILVWLVPFCGLAALLCGALYSLHHYWLPSATKAINNVCILIVAGLTYRSFGIYALALGHLAGAAVQCAVLWLALSREGFRFRFRFDLRDSRLQETVTLVVYPLGGQILGELRGLLENFCASFYSPGLLSALRYASRIVYAVSGVLMSSVVTATTPMVAHYVAKNDLEEMKKVVRNGVKLLIFMSMPVCILLSFEGEKLIRVLFERGQFSTADAALTSGLIALLTPYILFSRTISIMQTPFYAIKDTKTLVTSMVWSLLVYLVVIVPALYSMGVYGFPLATSLSAVIGTVVICILAHRTFGPMGWKGLSDFGSRMAGAMSVSCAGFIGGDRLSMNLGSDGFIGKCIVAAIPTLSGLIAFGCGALVFRLIKPAEIIKQFALLGSACSLRPLWAAKSAPTDSK